MRFHLLLLLALTVPFELRAEGDAEALKLLISVEQPAIVAPYPARVTLHLHNSGPETVWLYRHVRHQTTDGSMLEAHLAPVGAGGSGEIELPAQGKAFERVGLPRPRLVRLDPGEDYTEKATLNIVPAIARANEESRRVWGRYSLSVTYRAQYTNALILERVLGVAPWQGAATSNSIEIELQPSAGEGKISGTVTGKEGMHLSNVVVSLSDEEERLVDQVVTEGEGRFSFQDLPLGLYWVTVRHADFPEDTTDFRHLVLTADEPTASVDFLILPREVYDARKLLHKPVLLLVTDRAGTPLDKVRMEIVWTSGTVLEKIKERVADDGLVALQLIPGRSYITLRRRGCPKEERRVDLPAGQGIDGFKLTYDCAP